MTSWWTSTPAATSTGDCGHETDVNVIATLPVESHDQLWRLDEKARRPGALCGAVALLRALAHGAMWFGHSDRQSDGRLHGPQRVRHADVVRGAWRVGLRRLPWPYRRGRLHGRSERDGHRNELVTSSADDGR